MTDLPHRRRRLAAILVVDVVGFSKMMGRNEDRTIDLVLDFHETVKRGIDQHGGRVVATGGDSVLGDFDSIVEAMGLAAGLQSALHERNEMVSPEDRFEARIGLHLGDVVVEGDNVFGEGVNIAARLEELADPGGIALSEAVYQQVVRHTDLPIEEVGRRTLKNIERPVTVYRVAPESFGGEPSAARGERPRSAIRDAILLAVDEIKREVEEGRRSEDTPALERRSGLVDHPRTSSRVFSTATIVLVATGVMLVLARTTGWSENAWYPFAGAWLLGIGAGRIVETATRRSRAALLVHAIGIAAGASFFASAVTRAVLWVVAAAMAGAALQRPGANPARRTP